MRVHEFQCSERQESSLTTTRGRFGAGRTVPIVGVVVVAVLVVLIGLRLRQGPLSVIVGETGADDQPAAGADQPSAISTPASVDAVALDSLWQAYPEQYYSNSGFSGADRAKGLSYAGKDGANITIRVKDDEGQSIPQALCELYLGGDGTPRFLLRRPTNTDGVCSFLNFQPSASYQMNVFTYRGPASSIIFRTEPQQAVERTVTLSNKRLAAIGAGCIDPNGEDIYTLGSVQFDGKVYPDACDGSTRITENYCYEKPDEPGVFAVGQEDFNCPNGCSDSVCNP